MQRIIFKTSDPLEDIAVVGENFFQRNWVKLASKFSADAPDIEFRINAAFQLIPEHTNKNDINAVLVRSENLDLGYLPREIAAGYQSLIRSLAPDTEVYAKGSAWFIFRDGDLKSNIWLKLPSSSADVITAELTKLPGSVLKFRRTSREPWIQVKTGETFSTELLGQPAVNLQTTYITQSKPKRDFPWKQVLLWLVVLTLASLVAKIPLLGGALQFFALIVGGLSIHNEKFRKYTIELMNRLRKKP